MIKLKKIIVIVICTLASNVFSAENSTDTSVTCKNLKSCIEWVSAKTGNKYISNKLDKRTLSFDKDLNINFGNPEFNFTYILNQNELYRIKRENGSFEIVGHRELKEITFQIIKREELSPSFDYYAMEFFFPEKEKVKNAMLIFKKLISKNGRIVEASDGSRIIITDTANQLIAFTQMVKEI